MSSIETTRVSRSSVMQTTLLLVLGAETVLFGTLVMTYLFLRSGGSNMHFSHPKPLDLIVASLNTLVLLASAAIARRAQQAIGQGHVDRLKKNIIFALALGAMFIIGQIFEFEHAGMRIGDMSFGGVFFALVSFHALHVLAGMSVLGLNLVRAKLGDFTAARHVAVTAGTWFWYYVTGIWIVLFTVLYLV
jgi:cytochrome c oxidase subunit III